MCGIAGIVGRAGSGTLVAEMTRRLAHRGPDDQGLFSRGEAHLGHRRLSILDLSKAGHQPMTEGDLTLVYNGEIYNFQELRAGLSETSDMADFRSHSDTEVLLRLLALRGTAGLEPCHGMFAFALWDERRGRLLLARDRLGIKPLLYRPLGEGGLAFASELKSLVDVAPDGPGPSLDRPAVDPTSLRDFLSYKYVPTPKTIFRGVFKLPPGHTLIWEAERPAEFVVEPWWQPESSVEITDEDEAFRQFEELIGRVVKEHTVSDVPIGVFLSGGLDSTTLVANLEHASTFTLGFDVKSHDESEPARAVAEHFGAEHHQEIATGIDLGEALDAMPALYDEPFGDHGAWPMFMVARLARRSVTVALTGEGGDELFAGYQWYDKVPRFRSNPWNRFLAAALPALRPAARSAQRRAASGVDRYGMFLGPFTPQQKLALLSPDLLRETGSDYDDYGHFRRHWRDDLEPIKRLQWADLHTYLVDDMLTKVDRATMAVSLEARPPFVDHRLVEFALRLHPDLLRRGTEGKVLTRRHLAGRVPRGILERSKIGFSMPVRRWVRKDPAPLHAALGRLAEAGILRSSRDYPFTNEQLWCLLVLDRWWRQSGAAL